MNSLQVESPRLSVLRARLAAPYRHECGFWAGVLLLHRLLSAVVRVVFFDPVMRVTLLTIMMALFGCVHTLAYPFKSLWINRYQTGLLLCTLLVGVVEMSHSAETASSADL